MKLTTDKTVKKATANLPDGYAETLQEIKDRIRSAQVKAASILAQPVQEVAGTTLPQAVAEIPWGHNVILIAESKPADREALLSLVMTFLTDYGQGGRHE